MLGPRGILVGLALGLLWAPGALSAQRARIHEERRVIPTYPFSEPDPTPLLVRDERLYPYHTFEGYAHTAEPREWTVVTLENDLVEVFVLPEVGGKVWGAVVKKNGHEFIYRNEVLKFRNIALRGPWTSGGIEFNFGVIGHTPSTATPVDYRLLEHEDGSVSCVVGALDLPSRTAWRVEIRLEPGRAAFETRATWTNPTPWEQPYYNWMTAAAFARPDLEMSIPGNAFLEHSGTVRSWPLNAAGRWLPAYAQNTFAGHKSYHVVGELNDYFGGYYRDDDYGFGHWARYEEMPGQKLWLWALSREGGIWEDLLTDTDGQYVEYQAGRLFVQYSRGADVNPIAEVGFDPGVTDRWTEVWFPVEELGGLSDASSEGALHVERSGGALRVRLHAFHDTQDTLVVWADDRELRRLALDLPALVARELSVPLSTGMRRIRVSSAGLGLSWESEGGERVLDRPFVTDASARPALPVADRWVAEGRALARERRLREARMVYDSALVREPWNREALLGQAELEGRRGRAEEGLALARRALELDAYDAKANFVAGTLHRSLRRVADARDAFGWAARSMTYRSVANLQLAELALRDRDLTEAERYAALARDYDRGNLGALELQVLVARRRQDRAEAQVRIEELLRLDPLSALARNERRLLAGADAGVALEDVLRGEYPEQTLLELALSYHRRGFAEEALDLLAQGADLPRGTLLRAWTAWLLQDASALDVPPDLAFVFPFRTETLEVLRWAAEQRAHWGWDYLYGLNLWARDRTAEAGSVWMSLGERPDFAPFYVARAHLPGRAAAGEEADLRRALELAPAERVFHVQLVRYLLGRGRWPEALAAAEAARPRFPSDFNLQLLQARSLNELGQSAKSVDVLDHVQVLPSENARESHALFEQAHLLEALGALEEGRARDARDHAVRALEWPEHLGQGRPYLPEERLARYVLGVAEARAGNRSAARAAFQAVVDASTGAGSRMGRLDLLAIPARRALGEPPGPAAVQNDTDTTAGRWAGRLLAALARGVSLDRTLLDGQAGSDPLFGDLEGRLVLWALMESR